MGQNLIDFRLGYYVDKAVITEGNHLYYRLIVGNDYKEGTDIIIKAVPLDDQSDPDIFISKENKYPNSSADSEWQCASYGRDTCTIHHSDIKKNDIFYVGIVCPQGTCNMHIISMTSDEFTLEDGVEFQVYLIQNEARIFKFRIPEEMQDEDHIIIKGSSFVGNAHDFMLSVSTDMEKEDDLPSSNLNNRKSISAWKKGQVIRLNRESFPNDQWCKGCELKILMDVIEAGYYRIMVHTTDAIPKVYNGDQVDDIVGFDQIQCYQFYVKENNTDFQVTMTTYTGRIEARFNPGEVPTNWEDFQGKPDQDEEIILDIRPWLREHRFNQSKGNYFVCVRGEVTSTYTVKFREFQQDWSNSVVEDSYAELFGMRPSSRQTHLYKVPKLEFAGEDIKIEFNLISKRGAEPALYAAFCSQNSTDECKKSATDENIQNTNQNSSFKKATSNGQFLSLIIDHDEKQCQDLFKGEECYYVIYLVNPTDQWCMYKLQVSHNQNNHILLQERTPKIDSVQIHHYKYYKFTIIEQNILNISFEINPLHGDGDLLIARNITFPTKDNFEMKSTRIGSLVDHVSYGVDQNNTNLAGTYYIAVYGFSYSTYSILVNINRTQNKNQRIDDRYFRAVNLYQSIPVTKSLLNFRERFFSQFTVSIDENDNSTIVLSLHMLEHNCKTYIKYNEMPSQEVKDFEFDGSFTLYIDQNNRNYHRNGTYYIFVNPDPNFLDIFIDKTYTFSMIWRTFDKIPHLNSWGLQQVRTNFNEYSYFKHYILDNTQDIRLSLVTKGHQDLFVSVDPNNQNPKNGSSDFTTKFQKGGNYTKGKTLLIPMSLVKNTNPACQDLGYAEDNKCVVYVGVFCQDTKGCTAQLELEYDTKQPRRVYNGQSKHAIMSNDSYGIYYISIRKDEKSDIFAVLQTMSGAAYMEYNFQRFNDNYIYNTSKNHSISKLHTQTLKIKNSELQNCFINQTSSSNGEKIDECQVVFKVMPDESNYQENLIYNFAVYTNIIEVQNKQAIYGSVDTGEYQYFLYREQCVNCTMIISITGQSNDAVELIINKGTKLPNIKDSHIQGSKGSQLMSLNLKNTSYFRQNKIDTMEGNYVIGVFGLKDTTFLLTITSEEEPVITIGNDVPVKHSQEAGEIIYYQYYHWSPNDIQIQLQVQQGEADLLVSKYLPNEDEFISKLPSSLKKSVWSVENINSTNIAQGKELIILQDDRDFCVDCYYLIGVRTDDQNAMYTLELQSINAQKEYSNLLRVGDNKMVKLAPNEKKIFQFLLESEDAASIVPSVLYGTLNYYLGFSEESYKAFYSQSQFNNPIEIGKSSPDGVIHPDQNYYLILEAQNASVELSLQLQQRMTYISLYDGIPQTVFFQNRDDAVKNLQFNLPSGTFTVLITIKSKTKNFYPQTFIYIDQKLKAVNETTSLRKFQLPLIWDRDQYISQSAKKYTDMSPGNIMNIVLKYNMFKDKLDQNSSLIPDDSSGQIIVTLTYSQVIRLQAGEEYYGQLHAQSYSFLMFLINPPANRTVEITYSNCVGLNVVKLIKAKQDSSDIDVKESSSLEFLMSNGKEEVHLNSIVGQHYIMVETLFANEASSMENPQIVTRSSEFTIMVRYLTEQQLSNKEQYISLNGGHINFQPVLERRGEFKFSWSPLIHTTKGIVQSEQVEDVRYRLAYTKNRAVNLDQICSIKRRSDVSFIDIQQGQLEAVSRVETNQEFQFNVIAIVDTKQIIIPYRPVTINVPQRTAAGGRILITLVLVIFVVLVFIAGYCYYKNVQLTKKLRTELRDVHVGGGSEGVKNTYRKVEGGNSFTNVDD